MVVGKKRDREMIDTEGTAMKKKRPWIHLKSHQQQQQQKLISPGISSKILKNILLQQKEIENEDDALKTNDPVFNDDQVSEEDEDDDEDSLDWMLESQNEYMNQCEEVDEEEERILDAFMSKDVDSQHTLADAVLMKIKDNDKQVSSEPRSLPKLDQSVKDLYKGVGKFLSKYTSGKLPKAFKRIPSLKNWVDVLYLTEPENWTATAVYQATRIFASNLPRNEAERFYRLVLLPRVREDIRKNKRLNFSLFQALKKSIYKPKAFNKGILFPLCQSGSCTLREAVIIGSVIRKISIPAPHPGAALLKLAEMEYCGTTSYFIKLLLDKKYCLAYRVLDGLVAHFMRFMEDTRVMPVIWHQSLLTFVERYKNELTREDKDNLERLMHVQRHHEVTPIIKRELELGRIRGEKEDPASINYPPVAIEEDRFDIPDVPMEDD